MQEAGHWLAMVGEASATRWRSRGSTSAWLPAVPANDFAGQLLSGEGVAPDFMVCEGRLADDTPIE